MTKGHILDPGSGGVLAKTDHLQVRRDAKCEIVMLKCPKCRVGHLMTTGQGRVLNQAEHRCSRKTCAFVVWIEAEIYPKIEHTPVGADDANERPGADEDEREAATDEAAG